MGENGTESPDESSAYVMSWPVSTLYSETTVYPTTAAVAPVPGPAGNMTNGLGTTVVSFPAATGSAMAVPTYDGAAANRILTWKMVRAALGFGFIGMLAGQFA